MATRTISTDGSGNVYVSGQFYGPTVETSAILPELREPRPHGADFRVDRDGACLLVLRSRNDLIA